MDLSGASRLCQGLEVNDTVVESEIAAACHPIWNREFIINLL
jgi:hypothetical protein